MELHPLCTYFPRMSDDEFNALKANLKQHGQTHPIYTLEGMILDGGNRYRALSELGIEPITVEYTGSNPTQFILSSNLHRRHLSQGQSAAIVSASQSWITAQADLDANEQLTSVADRAKQSGVGQRTQQLADKLIKEAPADLIQEVIDGKKSLQKAIKEITPPKPPVPKSEVSDEELDSDDQQDDTDFLEHAMDSQRSSFVSDKVGFQSEHQGANSTVEVQKLTDLNKELKARIQKLTQERDEAIKTANYWKEQFLILEAKLKSGSL